MNRESSSLEQLGPQTRVQNELLKLDSHKRELWVVIIFAAAVVVLGAISFLFPTSFWHVNEIKMSPQVLFTIMMVLVVIALYAMRREVEARRLRLANLQQLLAAQADQAATMMDAVTNVFGRNFLKGLLDGEVARAERSNRPLTLIMCDLNNFKQVNDKYGHLMGDYVLSQMAGILKACVRGCDYVIRYGGDEFLVLLPETDEKGAEVVQGRTQSKVAEWNQTNHIGNGDLPISLSLGLYPHAHGKTGEQDVAEADARMYAEKRASKLRQGWPPPPMRPGEA
jgi:diguanylate cyclase (GGDEF)-like protein